MILLLVDLTPLETTAPTYTDKIVHIIMFIGVSLCLMILFPRLTAPMVAVLTILLGAATEGLQALVGRDTDWWDFIADTVGASVVLLIALALRNRKKRSETSIIKH